MKQTLLALICAGVIAGCGGGGSSNSNNAGIDNGSSIVSPDKDTGGTLTSLGADGWAIAQGDVTGGENASEAQTYKVTTRSELIAALYGSSSASPSDDPSNTSKLIYIQGSIDLASNNLGQSLDGSAFMQASGCRQNGISYSDYDNFYADYNQEYDPVTWNQKYATSSGTQELSGDLESLRSCYQRYQGNHTVLRVGSNTSILGLGEDAEIKFGTLRLGKSGDTAVENIVIRNITFTDSFDHFPQWDPTDSFSWNNGDPKGGRWNSQYDLISVENAKRVWIDHNTFSDGDRTDNNYPPVFDSPYNAKEQKVQHHDGLVDVTNGSTQVTLSYNHFKNHDKTNLLGGSDTPNADRGYGPGAIDVTFHHNYWENTGQRMPRVRYGRVHVYNNYYSLNANSDAAYKMGDAMALGTAAKIYVENNVFDVSYGSSLNENKVIKLSSSSSNKNKCLNAGYSESDCSTYFYGENNKVNGANWDLNSIASNQDKSDILTIIDPTSSSAFWLPGNTYSYQLDDVSDVKNLVLQGSGSGKLALVN